ncbi:glycosyltransferase [Paenarthrobacter nitroguajacolicus]|uniref:glycosyltransferase n=1 Tax=Paenarthrobacter nitroguajacolicus TaxID=211146 RepID=UPI00344AE641
MASDGAELLDGRATHFVLTRFNVRSFYHKGEPTDAWLFERLQLFEKYCAPSFRNQTTMHFIWLVFFDSLSPAWFKEKISALSVGLFQPVYVEGPFSKEFLSRTIGDLCSTPSIITTRVDNDDAVADDFIETIQKCFHGQSRLFINLVNGAQYAGNRLYLRPYTKNPFSSLIETPADGLPATVFVEHHYRIDDYAPVQNVKTRHPMWLQVVHGGNVLNEIVGLRTTARRIAPHFSADLEVEGGLLEVTVDQALGFVRILWRLIRKPSRVGQLAKTLVARTAGRTASK